GRVKGSVVNIHSERTINPPADDPFRQPVQPQRVNGMGTGVVLDPRRYVLTNYHVVDDVNSLRVRLYDGSGYTARVVAVDKESDLALIKIDPAKPLAVIGFGTSSDLMVGESVIGTAADLVGLKRRTGLRDGFVLRDTVTREAVEGPARRAVVVESVEPNSPAAEAGVKAGDVVEQVDDVTVVTSIDLERGLI